MLAMIGKKASTTTVIFFCCGVSLALEPNEISIIANKDVAVSGRIAQYYCEHRGVPSENVLYLSLGIGLEDWISRTNYEKYLAGPIRKELLARKEFDKIKCLLTTYGVPIKVGSQGQIIGLEERLKQLKALAEKEKTAIEQLEQNGQATTSEQNERERRLSQLQLEIDRISGKETNASVDSELSMVLFGPYELHRWQPNVLRDNLIVPIVGYKILMVSRLDGPDYLTVKALIDKAISAEKTGLSGVAYIDSRGIIKRDLYGYFDQSLRDLAMLTRLQTNLSVKEERTEKLFGPGECPQTAIYCGWYSLKKYIDAFDFVDGAIGYHISSFEAADLRDPNSTQWCPAMLKGGIAATIGAVTEPYLHSFPEPKAFFLELFNGSCLVEAYYRTNPYNSWQLILIGDPLYRPFKKN